MSRLLVQYALITSLVCTFGMLFVGVPTAHADDTAPPNLDQPPPNTDGGARSRNFTRVTPGHGGTFGGYTPYTVDGKTHQLDGPVTLPPECQTVSDAQNTSEVRNVRFIVTGTKPNLENRPDGEHAVFNSYLRALFNFKNRNSSSPAPDVTTQLQTRTVNFVCWVEGTPQPRPGVIMVHSPSIPSAGRSSGGDATTQEADGPVYVTRTSGDIDVNMGQLKDELVRFTGEFVGTKRVVCQVTVQYRLRMNRCVIKRGSYIRSFETTLTGSRSVDDANRIEYGLGVPQSGGQWPEPEGTKSAEKEKPKGGDGKKSATDEGKKPKEKEVGMIPGDSFLKQKEHGYGIALQYPERCVATTYVRHENSGYELTGRPGNGQPVFEIGQQGGHPDSAGPPPEPNRPESTDEDDQVIAGQGLDEITGGRGKDEFIFVLRVDPFTGESLSGSTLDDGDRIKDYESGETITIEGTHLKRSQIRLDYDENNDETRLGLDLNEDGRPDRTVVLDGDQRGEIQIHNNCCATPTAEIAIEKGSQGANQTSEDGATPGPKSGTGKTTESKPEAPADGNKDDAKSATNKHPNAKVNRPKYTKGDDSLSGREGPDELTGGPGKDEFSFNYDGNPKPYSRSTLDSGDRIKDYESGETITFLGVKLDPSNMKLVYDKKKNETRLEIDEDNDGKPDGELILDGDKRGTIVIDSNCCHTTSTSIQITFPNKKTKTAETKESSQPKPSNKTEQPKTTPSEKTESKKSADNSSKPADQSAVPQNGTGDSDLGLVKAEQALLTLLVKGEHTGQPVQEFTWKLVDEDPKLPPDPKQTPSRAPVAGNPYKDDVTGGEAAKHGNTVLISAQPAPQDDRPARRSGKKSTTWEIVEDTTPQTRLIVGLAKTTPSKDFVKTSLPKSGFDLHVISGYRIGDTPLLIVTLPKDQAAGFKEKVERTKGVEYVEPDPCWHKEGLNDPYFSGKGAWGQDFDDQWAIKRVGYNDSNEGAWKLLGDHPSNVIVAVIDTGLDWNHPDIAPDMLWRNAEEIPDNGLDDDGNGYVDDVIGWDFVDHDNLPWDHDGHGTFVTGVIAAAQKQRQGNCRH